jgi:hypothetical protein
MSKEMIDLGVYVGTQTVLLFGKERNMNRPTVEDYYTMNYNDGKFTARLNSVEQDLQAEFKKELAEFKYQDDPVKMADFELEWIKKAEKESDRRIKKIIRERTEEIRKFIKKIIPDLTKEEMEKITINLYDAIKRRIEIQIWMDRYYTEEEAIQLIKKSEMEVFQTAP